MSVLLAIVADDLTGALDTATPFVSSGLRVAVAVAPEGVGAALETGADVIAVSTVSRGLDEVAASARVAQVTRELLVASPPYLFKKIDSRLKGNPGAEAHALADAADRNRLVVAPAVPDQDRFTRDGTVVGRGVEAPIAIGPLFRHPWRTVEVADAGADGDLDDLVERTDWSGAVAVGARGLGLAFARRLGQRVDRSRFRPRRSILYAIGSRDPMTAAQMDALVARGDVASVVDAPHGEIPSGIRTALPALVRASGTIGTDSDAVARRFADGVASLVDRLSPSMLLVGGGDTAFAVLSALGVRIVEPRGEVEPGVPWFDIFTSGGKSLGCSVKSGGFGDADTLVRMLGHSDPAGDATEPSGGLP